MSARLLIVEDEETLRLGLQDAFALEGYEVTVAADGLEAERLLFSRHFDAVLLDLMLPGRPGLELLRELRAHGLAVPVLLLTARDQEADKVLGLELGADDYVTKPFGIRELVARVRALLRREARHRGAREEGAPQRFAVGAAEVDLAAFQIIRSGETHALSPKEAAILALLHREEGRAVSRERILDAAWGRGEVVGPRTIDTHVLNLRAKLESDPRQPRHLLTVHGVGYRLVAGA